MTINRKIKSINSIRIEAKDLKPVRIGRIIPFPDDFDERLDRFISRMISEQVISLIVSHNDDLDNPLVDRLMLDDNVLICVINIRQGDTRIWDNNIKVFHEGHLVLHAVNPRTDCTVLRYQDGDWVSVIADAAEAAPIKVRFDKRHSRSNG